MVNMIKIYIDTCIISRIFQRTNKYKQEELKSIEKISDNDRIIFVTSGKVLEELQNDTNEEERLYKTIVYKFISKINRSSTTIERGFSFPIQFPQTFGTIEDKEIFTNLKKIFDQNDSEHILNAIESKCDYFLTSDINSIVNKFKKYRNELVEMGININIIEINDIESILIGT